MPHHRWPLRVGLSFALLILLARCQDGPADPLRASGERLHDASGREILLHGVNARALGIFDVTFDDGRIPLEPIPPFGEEDCRFMAEELGLNHLRLPVNWSAIEPERGVYQRDYVDRILDLAEACARHDVHTVVDLHQDAYSKHIGEDGAPLWAIVPPPPELLEGPLEDLGERRLSPVVLEAFESFFANREEIQDAYAEMAAWLASRIEGEPGIIGLELMNEPFVLDIQQVLDDFHENVSAAVRARAPTTTIFFEPNSFRNFTDDAPVFNPMPFEDVVYSPHIYVDVFEDGWASESVEDIEASVARARMEARDHDAALYIGEFGHAPDSHGALYIASSMRVFDDHVASWALWLYEEYSQGSWGFYDAIPDTDPPQRGALREERADLVARAYPAAIAGRVESFAYDPASRSLEVEISGVRDDLDHVLATPSRTYPAGVVTRCDGVEVPHATEGGRTHLRCGGTRLSMQPAP